ncbi:hypothetical protein ACMD2_12486 [Ananas comosus]|uniref:Uncharacterized protein n=1 Tax=Ananas comosus TaxID=4615 RepID=A0A199UGA6_ANACO|nr:hypothetical protein ACMD2_12486 [Ananas comosus]
MARWRFCSVLRLGFLHDHDGAVRVVSAVVTHAAQNSSTAIFKRNSSLAFATTPAAIALRSDSTNGNTSGAPALPQYPPNLISRNRITHKEILTLTLTLTLTLMRSKWLPGPARLTTLAGEGLAWTITRSIPDAAAPPPKKRRRVHPRA